jgi:CDP-glucose 4,6-dehydratase
MGTINVLEALRHLDEPCAAVMVTTDKCYENREWLFGYRENDPLGGHDPYSASKAAAEIATASWRASFLRGSGVRVATARAGNVVGGGDWASDRIVPDCIRALQARVPIPIRNRLATRPWQHVLEPLSGYLWLAALLGTSSSDESGDESLESAFNLGPDSDANQNVGTLVERILQHWPGEWFDASEGEAPHEARYLHLATDKAARLLRWRPTWSFERMIAETMWWYRDSAADSHEGIAARTRSQIESYSADAAAKELAWASSCHYSKAPH